ncbi:MAG: LysE family transporter [Candidatus Omnitrophica bacterium]|nr:LysE family transporter [Candidatus Omnitrophota bacterium]
MYLLLLFITGFSLGITGAMIPGPLTLFTISSTLKTNKFAGLKTISGHILVEFLIITAIILGVQNFLSNPRFLLFTSLLGGLTLIAMGTILFFHTSKTNLSEIKTDSNFHKSLVAGGFIFSIASPGFIIWWATIGLSTTARAETYGILGICVLFIGHWLADILWYGSLSYAVAKGRSFLSNDLYRIMLKFFSGLLIMIGILLVFSAISG